MILLWATRGRAWGFRFLPVDGTGAAADPLPLYERAFSGHEDEDEGCWRTDGLLAVRLRDPEGRADEAGRVIPHELVLDGAATAALRASRVGDSETSESAEATERTLAPSNA